MYGASVLTMERAPFAISQFDDPVVEGDEPLSPLQVLFSLRGRIPRKTWWAYGVLGLPSTYLIGRDGRPVALAVGSREWESPPARALIEALLAEPSTRRGAR